MGLIKKLWPLSFKVKKNNYLSFFVCFFIYAAVCFCLEWLSGLTDGALGTVLYVIFYVVDVYSVIGVVMCAFRLFGVKNFDSDEENNYEE